MQANEEYASFEVKAGLAKMLKGGVIMDVINVEQAKIAEAAGAVAVGAPLVTVVGQRLLELLLLLLLLPLHLLLYACGLWRRRGGGGCCLLPAPADPLPPLPPLPPPENL